MRIRRQDHVAVLVLVLLWGLFSWRYLTPDQAMDYGLIDRVLSSRKELPVAV